jgi:hypothetical protein
VKEKAMTKTVSFKDVKPIIEAWKRGEVTTDQAVAAMFALTDVPS